MSSSVSPFAQQRGEIKYEPPNAWTSQPGISRIVWNGCPVSSCAKAMWCDLIAVAQQLHPDHQHVRCTPEACAQFRPAAFACARRRGGIDASGGATLVGEEGRLAQPASRDPRWFRLATWDDRGHRGSERWAAGERRRSILITQHALPIKIYEDRSYSHAQHRWPRRRIRSSQGRCRLRA